MAGHPWDNDPEDRQRAVRQLFWLAVCLVPFTVALAIGLYLVNRDYERDYACEPGQVPSDVEPCVPAGE